MDTHTCTNYASGSAMNMSQVVLDGVCNVESENTIDFDAGIHA